MTNGTRPMKMTPFNPRATGPQVSAWGDTYNPAGNCSACARPIFTVTDGTRQNYPDPRGFAGPRHSATFMEDYEGVLFCWDCLNEHGIEGYKRCEQIAHRATR